MVAIFLDIRMNLGQEIFMIKATITHTVLNISWWWLWNTGPRQSGMA
jgi:hypothetical protein